MGCRVAVWMLLLASASAMDVYKEMPTRDFDDYEMNNVVDTGPYWFDSNYPDYSDLGWKRRLIYFNLMKALQNYPERSYRADREPVYDQNMYDDDMKGIEKRVSDAVKASDKKTLQKGTFVRPLPKVKPRKGKGYHLCLFKICEFRPLT